MKKSQATEVATDIAAIKTAPKQQGYTIRKRPRQAAWTIIPDKGRGTGRKTGECYLLTYQPAPISAWILHPQTNEPQRQTILNIIQRTLAKQPTITASKVS
jgi:hypothetical protein